MGRDRRDLAEVEAARVHVRGVVAVAHDLDAERPISGEHVPLWSGVLRRDFRRRAKAIPLARVSEE